MVTVRVLKKAILRSFLAVLILPALFAGAASPTAARAEEEGGVVYTLTNAADGNAVVVYERADDGTLSPAGMFSTGGLGTGSGLGSQGALALSRGNRFLFAVNAGSSEISSFRVGPGGLELLDIVPSGGAMPISLAVHRNLLYVLNAGDSGNITGFRVGRQGKLEAIPGSTRPLSNGGQGAAPGPAQVSFSPAGDVVVVTEKNTNLIDVYAVEEEGLLSDPMVHPSAGATPFGFAFGKRGTLIVSEAFGGAPEASAASSYRASASGFDLVTASEPTTQTAACWVVVTRNGGLAYTTNAGSGSISSFRVGDDGSLELLHARAGETGAGSSPIDAALSQNSRYLYSLNSGTQTITAFQIEADGSLALIDTEGGLPAGGSGLAAH